MCVEESKINALYGALRIKGVYDLSRGRGDYRPHLDIRTEIIFKTL
jgi:hypothetical protein